MPRLNLVSLLYVFLALTYARHFSPIIPFYLPILIRLSHSYSLQAINCSNRYQNYTSDLPAPRKTSCARTSTTAMWASAVQQQQQHPHWVEASVGHINSPKNMGEPWDWASDSAMEIEMRDDTGQQQAELDWLVDAWSAWDAANRLNTSNYGLSMCR